MNIEKPLIAFRKQGLKNIKLNLYLNLELLNKIIEMKIKHALRELEKTYLKERGK